MSAYAWAEGSTHRRKPSGLVRLLGSHSHLPTRVTERSSVTHPNLTDTSAGEVGSGVCVVWPLWGLGVPTKHWAQCLTRSKCPGSLTDMQTVIKIPKSRPSQSVNRPRGLLSHVVRSAWEHHVLKYRPCYYFYDGPIKLIFLRTKLLCSAHFQGTK